MKYQTSPPPTPSTSYGSRSGSLATSSAFYGSGRLPITVNSRTDRHTATGKSQKYLRRLFRFQQMDFEFACWQMIYLFIAPQKVYRNFQYRKHTKDQFARDDPAFLVLLSLWLCGSSIGFTLILGLGFVGFFKFLLWVIFIDCIGAGLIIATGLWFVVNKYMRKPSCLDQDVEWGYTFDVHLNAYFPLLVILHVFVLFFYHMLIVHNWFLSYVFGNTLWLISCYYYVYITFLGYSNLAILKNVNRILYVLPVLFVIYIVSIACGLNICRFLMDFYQFRHT